MDTFAKFFSGTAGMIVAIVFCIAMVCGACILFSFVAPIVFPIGTPTP